MTTAASVIIPPESMSNMHWYPTLLRPLNQFSPKEEGVALLSTDSEEKRARERRKWEGRSTQKPSVFLPHMQIIVVFVCVGTLSLLCVAARSYKSEPRYLLERRRERLAGDQARAGRKERRPNIVASSFFPP
jgi:hypothetical protein